jgi:hypothetical protein
LPWHQYQVEALRQVVLLSAVRLTQQTLFSIPFDSVAVLFGHAYSDSAALLFVTNDEHEKMRITCANAVITATKIVTASDALFLRQQQWFGFSQRIILSMPQGVTCPGRCRRA